MNTIAAILIYLGIASCQAEVTNEMVEKNASTIISTVDNPNFINYYESQYGVSINVVTETENVEILISTICEGD